MTDFEGMREKHKKDSLLTLSFYIFIFLLFYCDDYVVKLFKQVNNNPENLFSVFEQSWVKFLITFLISLIPYFLGILNIIKRDFYYDIDNFFFKQRKKVDKFICEKMLEFRRELSSDEKEGIEQLKNAIKKEGRSELLMELFYKYIDRKEYVNPELKKQAFIYWGDYFSSITFIFFGIIFLIVAFVIAIISCSLSWFRLILLALVIFLVLYNFCSIRGKTAKKLFDIPQTQINQIHRNSQAELEVLNDLKAENFGRNQP